MKKLVCNFHDDRRTVALVIVSNTPQWLFLRKLTQTQDAAQSGRYGLR